MANTGKPPANHAKLKGERTPDVVDDAWVKPLIDKALEALDRGEGTPWRKGEVLERIKKR